MKIIFLLVFFVQFLAHSQYSQDYRNLIENIKPATDSIKVEHKYNNGKIRNTGWQTYYIENNQEYSFMTGKHYLYFKGGQWNETDYDAFGNIMLHRGFDSKGNLLYESKTKYISTTALSTYEFLESGKHLIYIRDTKRYLFSNKLCKYYLKKEGEITNGRKSGTWRIYYPDGRLKKEKEY
ncbi:hypothetical protein [Aequorivita marisscotiae]|uniref:MORN repeat variant n=1 Tax=Aequorivita marisscotiae TaxID=3040348 RepID=A0ABY8KTZ0_9FLAO|nr:hypothetical protein [Aequorivita sp. Ant34-E75]WGF92507.1 hypothetical protein QCQ61_15035 [Aequorivita sp. Ant34-E75]